MDRQAAGRKAEDLAADFLKAQGLELLLRNYRRRRGELDVVAREREILVIAEVRTRSSNSHGGAAASVLVRKRRRIVNASLQLLQQRQDLARMPVRFDVVVISDIDAETPKIEWIKHAFDAG